MSSTARRRGAEILNSRFKLSRDHVRVKEAFWQNRISLLQQLAVDLQEGLDSLSEVPIPNVERGIDFYDEISRFEMELIKRALKLMNGHQRNAAQLLNLKPTTLAAKIKHYRIQLGHPAFFNET